MFVALGVSFLSLSFASCVFLLAWRPRGRSAVKSVTIIETARPANASEVTTRGVSSRKPARERRIPRPPYSVTRRTSRRGTAGPVMKKPALSAARCPVVIVCSAAPAAPRLRMKSSRFRPRRERASISLAGGSDWRVCRSPEQGVISSNYRTPCAATSPLSFRPCWVVALGCRAERVRFEV